MSQLSPSALTGPESHLGGFDDDDLSDGLDSPTVCFDDYLYSKPKHHMMMDLPAEVTVETLSVLCERLSTQNSSLREHYIGKMLDHDMAYLKQLFGKRICCCTSLFAACFYF